MFNFKKKFGQNFILNKNVVNKIVSYTPLNDLDVVEIGPGMGFLTKELVKLAKTVTAYEIDLELKEHLDKLEKDNKNLKIIFEDFFKSERSFPDSCILISNPPYNLTSKILFYFLRSNIKKAILMFQKEIIDRLMAFKNNKEYNQLSVIFEYACIKKRIVNISKNDFMPKPKVDSSVIYLEKKDILFSEDYILFISNIFNQKRKTIINNINKIYPDKINFIKDYLIKNYNNEKLRAEQLDERQIYNLYNFIKNES